MALSDTLNVVADRLVSAAERGQALPPEECAAMARVVGGCALDAAALESTLCGPGGRLDALRDEAARVLAPPSNVVAFPGAFRCVTPHGGVT